MILVVVAGTCLWRSGKFQPMQAQPVMLRVGVDPSFPPLAFVDSDGQLTGLEVELARSIGTALDISVEFRNYPFDYLPQALQAGAVELAIGAIPCEEWRASRVLYLPSHASDGPTLVQLSGGSSCTVGKRVAMSADARAFQAELEAELEIITPVSVESDLAALRALNAGEASCAVVSRLSACLAKRDGMDLEILRTVPEINYCMALRPDSSPLYERILAFLQSEHGVELLAELSHKWLGCAN